MKQIHWDGALSQEGFDVIKGEGGVIVCPTKVGYIIMTADKAGLSVSLTLKSVSVISRAWSFVVAWRSFVSWRS